ISGKSLFKCGLAPLKGSCLCHLNTTMNELVFATAIGSTSTIKEHPSLPSVQLSAVRRKYLSATNLSQSGLAGGSPVAITLTTMVLTTSSRSKQLIGSRENWYAA